jgi:DNA polymerase-3 subunit alpha
MLIPGKERVATPPFVHLHNHTQCSFGNGTISAEELVRAVAHDGNPAVALTDHGNLFALGRFVKACWKQSVWPIVGCELSVVDEAGAGHHLTLLVRDIQGYRNLVALINAAHEQGFALDPSVPEALLRQHAEGLFALSGCAKGAIPCALLSGDDDRAMRVAKRYRTWFGDDRFFLELQHPARRPDQARINDALAELGHREELPLVATGNAHHMGTAIDPAGIDCYGYAPDIPPLTPPKDIFSDAREMVTALGHYPEAVQNTLRVASACTLTFPLSCPSNTHANASVMQQLKQTLKERRHFLSPASRVAAMSDGYQKRLARELEALENHGWPLVALAAGAVVNANDRATPMEAGPEAAVSLLVYLLGLSSVDPVLHQVNGPGILGPIASRRAPQLVLRLGSGEAAPLTQTVQAQLAHYGVVHACALRPRSDAEVFRHVAALCGATPEQSARAIGNLDLSSGMGDGFAWAHELCEEMGEAKHNDVRNALLMHQHLPAGPRADTALLVPPGAVASMLPTTRLADGRLVAQVSVDDARVLGFGTVLLRETAAVTFAREVLARIHKSQLLDRWPLWGQIPMDDEATWNVISRGDLGYLFDLGNGVAKRMFELARPTDLNSLALTLGLLGEHASARPQFFDRRTDADMPPVGAIDPFVGVDMLDGINSRETLMDYFRHRSAPALERATEWVAQLALRAFQDWSTFASNFWTIAGELNAAHAEWLRYNPTEGDPGSTFPALRYTRGAALHYAAQVYRHSYLTTHYARFWSQVARETGLDKERQSDKVVVP